MCKQSGLTLIIVFFSETFMRLVSTMNTGAELVGSWTVEVGDLDEAGGHMFNNTKGYIQRPKRTKHVCLTDFTCAS